MVDYHGTPITKERFNYIEKAGEGYFRVEKGSKQNIMRRDGSLVLKEWPHRVWNVQDGYFTFGYTRRKAKTTPTKYEDGVAHVSGIIVFPPIFGIIKYEGNVFSAEIDKTPYVIYNGALYDPEKKHYPPKAPSFGKFIEKILNWTLPGLQFYYRDTDADIDVANQYPVGKVLRTGLYVDMTTKLQKPVHKTRFIIASAHAAQLFSDDNELLNKELANISPNGLQWRHSVIHRNAWLKVLDVFELNGVTQIFLLHIPETVARVFGNEETLFKFIDEASGSEYTLIDAARQSLEDKMNEPIHPRSLDYELIERMRQPIGYDEDGNQYSLEPSLAPGDRNTDYYSRYIHSLADDRDIVQDIDGFPWQGIVGSICEGCMYANGTNGKPFGCGRLFQETFRTNYIKGECEYYKCSLGEPSRFEERAKYKKEREAEHKAKTTGTYATNLILDFIKEKLDGNIDNLIDFDFRILKEDKKYGPIKGPSSTFNYAIIKSIMEVVFGEYWPELNVENLDKYLYQTGTLINYQRLFGARIADRNFKALSSIGANDQLIDLAEEIHSLAGTIGNFVVWPNKARLFNVHDDSKMRGYIDRLFVAIYDVMTNAPKLNLDIKGALFKNRKLMADYKGEEGFQKFMHASLLEAFLNDNRKPILLFEGISNSARDYNPARLPIATMEYHSFFSKVIPERTKIIVEVLKDKLL